MSSRGLLTFTARAVPLMAMVLFSMNICGQEDVEVEYAEVEVEVEYAELVIGCRNPPSRASAVSLEVAKAWLEERSLVADLLVTNHSESAIRLPRENVSFRYWHIAVLPPERNDETEPIVQEDGTIRVTGEAEVIVVEHKPFDPLVESCGGLLPTRSYSDLLRMSPGSPADLVAEQDIETIAPGQTVLLRAVQLESFSREPSPEMRFEVTYRGGSSITVSALTTEALHLAEARARHCSLYGGELKSNGHVTP